MEDLDGLREELATLGEEEARVSAERRHLHRQIDFGFASETARTREREVSDRRRELHRRIDGLRERLGMPVGPQRAPAELSLEQISRYVPVEELERIGDSGHDEAASAEHGYIL